MTNCVYHPEAVAKIASNEKMLSYRAIKQMRRCETMARVYADLVSLGIYIADVTERLAAMRSELAHTLTAEGIKTHTTTCGDGGCTAILHHGEEIATL